MKNFANRLSSFRKSAGLTQAETGALLGVTGNYVYLLETGKKEPSKTLVLQFETLEKSPLYNSSSLVREEADGYRRQPTQSQRQKQSHSPAEYREPSELSQLVRELLDDLDSTSGIKRAWLLNQLVELTRRLRDSENK